MSIRPDPPGAEPSAGEHAPAEERIVALGLYWQPRFWSLGPRTGVNSFFLAPQGFARFGHEVHVSAPRDRGQPACEVDEGIRIHRYRGAIRFDSNPRRVLPLKLVSRVVRFAYYLVIGSWNGWRLGRRVRPDVVIGYHYHAAWPAWLVARLLGRPNVTRLFGTQLGRVFDHPLKRLGAFIQWIAFKTPTWALIIHDDGSEGDVVARRLGVPPEKLHFWRDGYDPTLHLPDADLTGLRASLGIPEDHVILFCVGRMEEDKRMDRLVEMLPAVLREEPKVSLMLVGDGGDRPGIERRARELGITDRLVLTGAVARDRIAPYINLGDIFVGVSDRTNVNVPPIEAMSCGKPLVVLNTGGTDTLVQDGVQGLLVDPARWEEELPRAIVTLVRDPARRVAMGRAGLETVQATIPTLDQRQKKEVDLAVTVVREWRARRRRSLSRGAADPTPPAAPGRGDATR